MCREGTAQSGAAEVETVVVTGEEEGGEIWEKTKGVNDEGRRKSAGRRYTSIEPDGEVPAPRSRSASTATANSPQAARHALDEGRKSRIIEQREITSGKPVARPQVVKEVRPGDLDGIDKLKGGGAAAHRTHLVEYRVAETEGAKLALLSQESDAVEQLVGKRDDAVGGHPAFE